MAIFTLEALDAKSGDALLLHYGDSMAPRLIIIDGGFVGTYTDRVKRRLKQLRADVLLPDDEQLVIEQVVVTHIDRDHISGITRMFRDLRDDRARQELSPWRIERLWHNSFADVIEVTTGSPTIDTGAKRAKDGAAGLAEGRELRDYAELLQLDRNPPFNGLVKAPATVPFADGLEMTIVGPTQHRIDELKEHWEKDVVPAPSDASKAAYIDKSVPNLASIAMLVAFEGKSMLLTGDARGDDTLVGIDEAGLADADGKLEVDILKVPHHGSVNNVERDYFERIVADHYVISANGAHHNPDHDMLELLVDTQGDRAYTIHLTNEAHASAFFDRDKAANPDRNYSVIIRPDDQHSVFVDLADPF